ncbi:hypothetical protein SSX86_020179 [Deinandra increscens subsp. villosa]|uniref:Uncharacterized protein n=1 Tax=Deinandra increscens subsp. villosa TaxID=3103831 RepID=A0AAP0CSJ6_9ASTR
MEPETKKRKVFRPPPRRLVISSEFFSVNVAQPAVVVDLRIQQAKNHAIAQAQQDGSKANFRIFDSPFGNFLVPAVPTRAELGG